MARLFRLIPWVVATLLGATSSSPAAPAHSAVHAEPSGQVRTLRVGGAEFALSIRPGRLGMDAKALERVISSAARGVSAYYGAYPVPRIALLVLPTSGSRIGGTTFGDPRALVRLELGANVSERRLQRDWVLTHELLHTTFPSLEGENGRYQWVGEGLSTYLEPIVRVRAGTLSEATMWRELVRDAPKGLPEAGDRGLDFTHTWGRTYWGGALYWLEVDVAIREQTQGRRSLADALRAVAAAGGTVDVTWPFDRVISIGDAATGTHALRDVHQRRGLTAQALDLDALWRRLGVRLDGERVTFDAGAPAAAVRRGITAP